jgi:hypothetical protein
MLLNKITQRRKVQTYKIPSACARSENNLNTVRYIQQKCLYFIAYTPRSHAATGNLRNCVRYRNRGCSHDIGIQYTTGAARYVTGAVQYAIRSTVCDTSSAVCAKSSTVRAGSCTVRQNRDVIEKKTQRIFNKLWSLEEDFQLMEILKNLKKLCG